MEVKYYQQRVETDYFVADEESSLLQKYERSFPKEEKDVNCSYYYRLAGILFTIISLSLFLGIYHNDNSFVPEISDLIAIQNARNVYKIGIKIITPDYDQPKSLQNLPWAAIAEPHKTQEIYVSSFIVDGKLIDLDAYSDSLAVSWNINGTAYENVFSPSFKLTNTGVVTATVTALTLAKINGIPSGVTFTYEFDIAVKYVRREIRTLTTADRVSFFSALKKIYTLTEAQGQAKYGSKFHNAEYYLVKHLAGAATTDCDHWHDGAGIVTHHVAVTLEMEQSLQAIDPSMAMPYWEYGMDPYLYDDFASSPIFRADWYGEASPGNSEHRIADGGLWDGVALPDGTAYRTSFDSSSSQSLNPFVNAYGHLRSPWNNNPSRFIGRSNTTYGVKAYSSGPTCPFFQNCFQQTELSSVFNCLNGRTHGPVHIMIGGTWNQGDTLDETSYLSGPNKLLLFKVLWRMGITRCPETCDVKSSASCRCAVPQEYLDTYGAYGVLDRAGLIDAYSSRLKDASEDTLLTVIRALEDPGIAGDMYSSAASFDPTFWPLHGAAERLVGLKRAMVSSGDITYFDETWDYFAYNANSLSSAAYLNGVCDWSKVKGVTDLTFPNCTTGVWCSGHYEDDVLEFGDFLNKGESYTNAEFYEFMHPWNSDLPYTYDTFDYDYCTDQGYGFNDYSVKKSSTEKKYKRESDSASPM